MKVEWTFQYVPPTICHHFLRIGLRGFLLWVKMPRKQTGHCFQNAPKVPFSLRKGFKTNIFTGWWKNLLSSWFKVNERGSSDFQKSNLIFLTWFRIGSSSGQEADRELWGRRGGFTFYNLGYVFSQRQAFKTSYVFYIREIILTHFL